MRPVCAALGLGLLVSIGGEALAQPSPAASGTLPPPQTLPREVGPPPPTPPAVVRARLESRRPDPGAYRHDGFYLRFGLGLGYVAESVDVTDSGRTSSLEVKGAGVPVDFALGGTLGGGFVLGGVLHTMLLGPGDRAMLPMPASERDDEHAATLSVLGLFGDWYLDSASGFHLQGMIGAGTLLLSDTADSDYAPAGSAVSVGAGYSWWIGPDSSAGILARADYASLLYDDDAGTEYDHRLLHLGVTGTVTYH